LKFSKDLGPASRPCHPSGISLTSTTFVFAVFEKSSAAITSTGI